jgi:hypothetical protein
MVFDLGGVHCLVVRYCGCGNMADSVPRPIQLLRVRWFPATINRPSTAFTFDLLDFFHTLQNRNKCNPYNFYHTIIQRTDAAGLDNEIVCFPYCFFNPFTHLFPKASLQRDHVGVSHLELPTAPQTRGCRSSL